MRLLLVGVLLLAVGCSDDPGGGHPIDYANTQRFVDYIHATYKQVKPWPHNMIAHAGNYMEFNRVGIVKGTSGRSTVQKLMGQAFLDELRQDLDDPDRRAIYARGIIPSDQMRVGPANNWPITIASLSVSEWNKHNAQLIEDPTKNTPLSGLVLLPVGSDPQIDPNPDLAALIDKIQRLAKAYHGSLP
jgi:hypothetical protein